MMPWFWLCREVQHRHVQETSFKCSCVIGAQMTRHTDDGQRCKPPCSAWPLVPVPLVGKRSWWGGGGAPAQLPGMQERFWRQREARLWSQASMAIQGGWVSPPRAAELSSMAGLWSRQHLLLMAVVSPAQGHQTVGESPLPTWWCCWRWAKVSRLLWYEMGRHVIGHMGHPCPHGERAGCQAGSPRGPCFGN